MDKRWRSRLGWGLLTIAGASFLVTFIVMLFGQVVGEEFSPFSFQRRSFHYFKLPLLRVQVWPVRRVDVSNDLEEFLGRQAYLAGDGGKTQWDLVRSRRSGRAWQLGDAHLLCRYLDAVDDQGIRFWFRWTQREPEKARLFWSEVADLAQADLYFLIPELFQLAEAVQDAAGLQQRMETLLSRKLEFLAVIQHQQQNYTRAIDYYSRALEYDPSRNRSELGLAQCREALEEIQ